ncbi:MAG: thioredoxin family protein [Myxococcales bacterium]
MTVPASHRKENGVDIKVLGTGCAKCKKLYAEAEKAIASSGQSPTLEKVEKLDEIMKYGVMVTPALVINGEVKSSGRIPSTTEIVGWIGAAATKDA